MPRTEDHNKSHTITPFCWSTPQVIAAELKGKISKEDHVKHIRNPIAKSVEEAGWFNLLLSYNDFLGWEPEAAESSFNSMIDYGRKARKLAYVNPPDKKRLQMKLTKALFNGEVRFFENDQLEEARQWILTDD